MEFCSIFLGETAAETETAANTYKSVVAGTDSGIECNAINSWNDDQSIAELKPYLYHLCILNLFIQDLVMTMRDI